VDWPGIAAVIAAFGTMFTGLAVLVTAWRTERKLAKTNGDILEAAAAQARELAVVKHRLAELTGIEHNRRADDPPPPPPGVA
jgi:hypothetical protein